MIPHPMFGHFFIFCSRSAVVCIRVNGDSASRREFAPYFNAAGVHLFDQVIHDDVHAILVEEKAGQSLVP